MLRKLLSLFRRSRPPYVIADPRDSSITLSESVYNHLASEAHADARPRVFVFHIPATGCYGFMLDPNLKTATQICDLQQNSKTNTLGFETLCPTVARILYDYKVPFLKPIRLAITIHKDAAGQTYYQIERPQ